MGATFCCRLLGCLLAISVNLSWEFSAHFAVDKAVVL